MASDDARSQHEGTLESGELSAQISRAIVQLYKECYGKGPTKARTHFGGDLVVCLLQGGFVQAEKTREAFLTLGRDVQETLREQFIGTVEELTGRRVVTFISGVDVHSETNAELFVLEAAPPDMGDERQAVAAWAEQTRRKSRDLRSEAARTRHQQAARREP